LTPTTCGPDELRNMAKLSHAAATLGHLAARPPVVVVQPAPTLRPNQPACAGLAENNDRARQRMPRNSALRRMCFSFRPTGPVGWRGVLGCLITPNEGRRVACAESTGKLHRRRIIRAAAGGGVFAWAVPALAVARATAAALLSLSRDAIARCATRRAWTFVRHRCC